MALTNLTLTSYQAFHGVLLLLAVQTIISSAEYLSIPAIFRPNGLLSWQITRLSYPKLSRWVQRLQTNQIFLYPGILGVFVLRMLLSVYIIMAILLNYTLTAPLVLLALISLLTTVICHRSNNGADQMASILILALVLAQLGATQTCIMIALLFVAGQASLAYATAGVLKATKKRWHNGHYLLGILSTATYGHRRMMNVLKERKLLAVIASKLVVYGDIALAFAIICPPPLCIMILGCGILLHMGIGIVMGLNTFVWSFCATYPAIYFVSCRLYHVF